MNNTRYDYNFTGLKNQTRPLTLVIDSKDRNTTLYPEPNKYKVKLDPNYKEITCIELVAANVPKSLWNINEHNGTLYFREAEFGDLLSVVVPPGNYSISDLLDILVYLMNGVSSYTYTWNIASYTNIVEIMQTGGTWFELNFIGWAENTIEGTTKENYLENSIGKLLGFPIQNFTNSGSSPLSISGFYPYNIEPIEYITLNIKNINFGHIHSNNQHVKNVFAIFPLSNELATFNYTKQPNSFNPTYTKILSQPLADLKLLEFEWRDSLGNLYEFNNQEHLLVFEIYSNTQLNGFFE